jgi:hypothetical protein
MDDKVIIINNTFNLDTHPLFENQPIDVIESILMNSSLIVFDYQEDLPQRLWDIILFCAKNSLKTYINGFTQPLKMYFDKTYPNNKIYFPSIEASNWYHMHINSFTLFEKSVINERKYLLKYFSACRKPWRDYVILFLRDNGLINQKNLICFRNRGKDHFNHLLYKDYNSEIEYPNLDYFWLDNLNLCHPSQENIIPWDDQNAQDIGLFEAHFNSYFDIISEAVVPYKTHPNEIGEHISSVSKRTIFPLLCRNVFHIYPENKPLENYLKELGIEFFFESDNEFCDNITSEFYMLPATQEKLNNNFDIAMTIISHHLSMHLNRHHNTHTPTN